MRSKIVSLPTAEIADWPSFHGLFRELFGFPRCYSGGADSWIDCMALIDAPEHGLSTVTVASGELLVLRIEDAADFRTRLPDQYAALLDWTAKVNFRREAAGKKPVLALMPTGGSKPLSVSLPP